MILAFDTSSAACTAALFDGSGACIAHMDERIGRGHSERLVPMIAELLDGRTPDEVVVGVGPGSFTGIRVGIAAAHGLAIGWGSALSGMSSLALLAAGADAAGEIAAAVEGGHGELFVQQFDGASLGPNGELANLSVEAAADVTTAEIVVGSGAERLVEARGWGKGLPAFPSASHLQRLPEGLRTLAPRPIYARGPDARAKEAA